MPNFLADAGEVSSSTITRLEAVPPLVRLVPSSLFPSAIRVPGTTSSIVKVPARIRIHWLAGDDFGKYLVRWVTDHPSGLGGNVRGVDIERGGRSGVYELWGAIPGVTYFFNVKGGWGWPWRNYTEWSHVQHTIAQPHLRGLREHLSASELDPGAGLRRYVRADGGSVRAFMQLS